MAFDSANEEAQKLLDLWCEEAVHKHLAYGTDPDVVDHQVVRVCRFVQSKLEEESGPIPFSRDSVLEQAHRACLFFYQDPVFRLAPEQHSIAEVMAMQNAAFPELHSEEEARLIQLAIFLGSGD